ncbi:hypothetical protein SPD48_14515 [Pseudogracilibacillus sp. SE30717A]|uniref:hypothetical protein n=1 Tax=Pseudogracilibacillus sp. SE30717A TaxID=3098293 RepID=UPI00300E17CD
MNNNQAHQNNNEQTCLYFTKNNIQENNCYGMSKQQFIEIQNWLKDAKPNENSNKFPDFIFNDGFIEHFAVTSSFEGKKGAKQKKESMQFKSKSEANFIKNLDSCEEDTLVSKSFARPFEQHSHSNIVKSIKRNWEKHIKNYEKSNFQSKHSIFLLEYTDNNIHTAICVENEPSKVFDSYRISADKELLNWIYKFKDKIDYLILINLISSSIEVIRIENIPEIIDVNTYGIFEPVIGLESHKFAGIKIAKRNI